MGKVLVFHGHCLRTPKADILSSGLTAFGSIMYASFGFSTLEVLLVDIPRSVVSLIIFVSSDDAMPF